MHVGVGVEAGVRALLLIYSLRSGVEGVSILGTSDLEMIE